MSEKIDNSELASKIKTSSRLGIFQRLASFFGFSLNTQGSKKDRKEGNVKDFNIIPNQPKNQYVDQKPSEALKDIENINYQDMSSTVQDLFDSWMSDTQNTYANINERIDRLNALTYMIDNQSYIKAAVILTANAVADTSSEDVFSVISEDEEWADETNILIKDIWKINSQTLYDLAYNLEVYGEAFQGLEVLSSGISSVEILKPTEIAEKLVFKPLEVSNFYSQMKGSGSSTGFTVNLGSMSQNYMQTNTNFNFTPKQNIYKSKDDLLKQYIENITDTSSNEMFKTHLLGYRLPNDQMVAPWQIQHYVFGEHSSEFYPYGDPPLLSCLSAFKQAQRAAGLEDIRKMLSLPFTQYKVKTGGVSIGKAFDIVNTVKERYENVGLTQETSGLEGPSLTSNIWTSDDLVTVDRQTGDSTTTEGTVSEQKYLDSKIGICTFVPKSYIDPSSEGFQMSGAALAQLFTPFRYQVENIRKIIVKGMMDLIELHYAIQNKKVPNYVLTINSINTNSNENVNSSLQQAETVLEAVAGLLGVEIAELPKSVKKDILTKYGSLSSEELNKWLQSLETEGKEEVEVNVSEEDMESSFGDEAGTEGSSEGDNEGFEESYNNKKKKLLEQRYRLLTESTLDYYLTEALDTISTKNKTLKFVRSDRQINPELQDVKDFMKTLKTTRKGKKRLRS